MKDNIPPDVLPPDVAAFVDELTRAGFSIVRELYDDQSFGNALIDLERDGLAIQAVLDRSQWFLSIAAPGGTKWFGLHTWWAYLDGVMSPLTGMSLLEQIEFVRKCLPRIQEIMRDPGPEVLEELEDWQYRHAQQRGLV